MKKNLINWLFLSFLTLGFVSCGGDDDPDPNRPESQQKETKLSYSVVIGANTEYKQTKTLKLNEILPEYSQYVTKGELQMNSSNIKVTGLSNVENPSLQNFTIAVPNSPNVTITLGTITKDTVFTTNDALTFMQKSIDYLVSKKSADVAVSFLSKTDINSAENVKVELNYTTTYKLK